MCNNIKYKRKQFMKNVNNKSWINAVIICVMAIFLVWYTSSAYSNMDDIISHTETIRQPVERQTIKQQMKKQQMKKQQMKKQQMKKQQMAKQQPAKMLKILML